MTKEQYELLKKQLGSYEMITDDLATIKEALERIERGERYTGFLTGSGNHFYLKTCLGGELLTAFAKELLNLIKGELLTDLAKLAPLVPEVNSTAQGEEPS